MVLCRMWADDSHCQSLDSSTRLRNFLRSFLMIENFDFASLDWKLRTSSRVIKFLAARSVHHGVIAGHYHPGFGKRPRHPSQQLAARLAALRGDNPGQLFLIRAVATGDNIGWGDYRGAETRVKGRRQSDAFPSRRCHGWATRRAEPGRVRAQCESLRRAAS